MSELNDARELDIKVSLLFYPPENLHLREAALRTLIDQLPRYTEDLNAIYEACLSLGYTPKVEYLTSSMVEVSIWNNTGIYQADKDTRLISMDKKPKEVTQAIAAALCVALIDAMGDK